LTEGLGASPGAFADLGARPEVGGGGEAVEYGGLPEGLAEPPFGVVVGHGELFAGDGIKEEVVDDAMVGRVEAGDDGVVVGECEGGEDGDEAGLSLRAVLNQTMDVGSGGFEVVSETEAVGGNEDDDGVRERRGGDGD